MMEQMMNSNQDSTRRVRVSKERILREQERLLEQLEKSEKARQMIYIVLLFGVMISIGTPPEAQKLLLGMLLLIFLGAMVYKSPYQIEIEREYDEVSKTMDLLEERTSSEDDPQKEVTVEIPMSFQIDLPAAQNRNARRSSQKKKHDRPRENQARTETTPNSHKESREAVAPQSKGEQDQEARTDKSHKKRRRPRKKKSA